MTEMIVSRGDTFPRTYLDCYRAQRTSRTSETLYNELKSSKSDELVLQSNNTVEMPISEMYHGHSENVLDANISPCVSPTQNDFLDSQEQLSAPSSRKRITYDRIDPEDSIRDMVTENDFYRFVLFKKHYDKYLHLSQKYEEVKNMAYYLEEKYHELKMEKDDLLSANKDLAKRLENSEMTLREKEDEVFLQLERVVYLEDQCEKIKCEKQKFMQEIERVEKEKNEAYRLLKIQAQESEANRRTLERARQEIVRQMTAINTEKEWLERENVQLRETLEEERRHMNRYSTHSSCSRKKITSTNLSLLEKEMSQLKLAAKQNETLNSQLRKGLKHLATCKRRKCSVCAYTKSEFQSHENNLHAKHFHDQKLFSCLQTPFQDLKNKMKHTSSPIRDETESLSEFFRPSLNECSSTSTSYSSVTAPFEHNMAMSYMDDCSSLDSSNTSQNLEDSVPAPELHGRGFGSDSGFSSDLGTDCKSLRVASKEKFIPKATLDEADCQKLQRTKWTASFRKLINKVANKK